MITRIKNYLWHRMTAPSEKPVAAGYDVWSASYDYQPGNLMLDLDEQIFCRLSANMDLTNKRIADIGCGTGRHWRKLYAAHPAVIMGFDVSEGMLVQLKRKFPDALVQQITDNRLAMVPCTFVDFIISTLTIAHIKNIEEAIAAWARILKPGGGLLLTDFHPAILSRGGKRSFHHDGKTISVINYVHPLEKLTAHLSKYGFNIVMKEERYVDETVRQYYEAKNALPVYERFRGLPVIYGLYLMKEHAAA